MTQRIGTAYVDIAPNFSGGNKAIEKELAKADPGKASKSVGGKFTKGLKRTVKVGLAGGALFAGVVAKKGLDRLMGIEDARASLSGLGHDGKAVDKIMVNALDSVKGTAFGMADAGKTAASMVAAGIKPGKDLTETLKLVGDTATIAKTDLGEMGAIFGKVASGTKGLQGEVINQFRERGIPIIQMLSESLGKSVDQVQELSRKGKVSFEDFSAALQKGLGGAALKSGETLRGSIANLNAAFGRIGANFLEGVYPKLAPAFQKLTKLLGPVEDRAAGLGKEFGRITALGWGKLQDGAAAIKALFDSTAGHGLVSASLEAMARAGQKLKDGFDSAAESLGRIKTSIGSIDLDNLDGKSIGKALGTAIGEALGSVAKMGVQVVGAIGRLFASIDWVGLGIEVGKSALPLALGIIVGIVDGLTDVRLWSGIWKNLDSILLAALGIALTPTRFIGPIAKLLAKIPFAGKLLAWLLEATSKAGKGLLRGIGELFRNMWLGFRFEMGWFGPTLIARFMTMLKELPGRMKGWGADLALKFGDALKYAFWQGGRAIARGVTDIVKAVAKLPGKMLRAIGKLGGLLIPAGTAMMGGLRDAIADAFGEVRAFLRDLPPKIIKSVGDLSGVLVEAGKDIMRGLARGIERGLEFATEAISGVAGKVVGAAKGAFKIFSPSRVMQRVGEFVSLGLASGIAKGGPKVVGAIAKVAKSGISFTKLLRKSIRSGMPGLEKEFARISKTIDRQRVQTERSIAKSLSSKKISKDRAKALRKIAAQDAKAAQKIVDQQAKALKKLAKQADKHLARIADLKSERASLMDSIRSSIAGELDLGSLNETNEFGYAKPVTFGSVSSLVAGMKARALAFAGKMKALLKAGIPPGLVQEVAALGTQAGMTVANALLSGSKAEVKALASDYTAFQAAAKSVGDIVAGGMFDSGIAAQEGLLKGLLDDKAIKGSAEKLAKKLTKAVKKALGIKSPSRKLWREVGIPSGQGVGLGAIDGMDSYQSAVDRRLAEMFTIPSIGQVRLPAGVGPLGASSSSADDQIVALLEAMLTALRQRQNLQLGRRQFALGVQDALADIKGQF